MKLKQDKLLSNFGFNINLRHYTEVDLMLASAASEAMVGVLALCNNGDLASGCDLAAAQFGEGTGVGEARSKTPSGDRAEDNEATRVLSMERAILAAEKLAIAAQIAANAAETASRANSGGYHLPYSR